MQNLSEILSVIIHACEYIEEELKQESNLKLLTSRQIQCLELIKKKQNPTLSELAENMNIAKASISVMIERLEKNKFIYKIASDSDRRVAHIHLTHDGEKAAVLHNDLHKKIAHILTDNMTDSEKEILLVLLNKSVQSLSKTKM